MTFQYSDFTDVTGFNLAGTATGPQGAYAELNPDDYYRTGALYALDAVNLANFSTHFQFTIGHKGDDSGADGFTFVLSANLGAMGNTGGGLGYEGMDHSVAIEFDTYPNGGADPNDNHIAIDLNGSLNSVAVSSPADALDNGKVWDAWIDYVDGVLTVRYADDGIRPETAQVETTVDLASIIGDSTAYAGFTASTGGARETHNILNWSYGYDNGSGRTEVSHAAFDNTEGLGFFGSAAPVYANSGIRLTGNDTTTQGAFFTQQAYDITDFGSHFQFRISDPLNGGADGLTFVISAENNSAAGNGLGYGGLEHSLAIEFDTFLNAETGDPDGNHIGIDDNGSLTSATAVSVPAAFDNGDVWDVWVDYSGGVLTVRYATNGVRPETAQLSRTVDLAAVIGSSTAFLGFTAGTSSAAESHDILSWSLSSSDRTITPGTDDNDVQSGTDNADIISTLAGNDSLGSGAGNDILNGGSGDDTLDGGTGDDTAYGSAGNDSYVVDAGGDRIVERAGEGTDTVLASITWTLAANLENLTLGGTNDIDGTGNAGDNALTGNGGANRLTGLGGHDWLDGGAGADTLIGGLGNDTYIVDSLSDVVTELTGQGTDTLLSAVSWTIANASSIETLTLTGSDNISGFGNSYANALNGNSGNNTLNGGSGADTLTGGTGDDVYVVENAGDVVIEGVNAGTDTVQSAITYILGDNVENLTLSGSGNINGTGNALVNTLVGTAGNNMLTGGGGADRLYGRGGNDTYVIDNAATTISELLGGADAGGIDEVRSSVSYALKDYIENLSLTGTAAINAVGNALNNVLTGNSGNNLLTGGAGNDTLAGGLGADQFIFGAGSGVDTISDFSAAQTDRINVHLLANGVIGGAGIILTQVGGDTLIDLGGGNTVTVTGALKADVQSHMIW